MTPRVSVVIPAFEEQDTIDVVLRRIVELVDIPFEVLVAVDDIADPTVEVVEKVGAEHPEVRVVVNDGPVGPGHAIRAGFAAAVAPVIVITMADGADDAAQIAPLARLVERGVAVAAASRYVRGGRQIGGAPLKTFLSRLAGKSLRWFAGVGISDATNSFKAYDADFVRSVGIDSTEGFAVGLELVAKARRTRRMMAELPTIWLERQAGESKFRIVAWLPTYMRWYRFAFGPALTPEEVRARCSR